MMKSFLKKSNLFFFGEEEIHSSDFAWFYGMYGFIAVIGSLIAIINIMNMFQ